MDIVLVSVTLASLGMAVWMGLTTWRALRLNRAAAVQRNDVQWHEVPVRAPSSAGLNRAGDWTSIPILPGVEEAPPAPRARAASNHERRPDPVASGRRVVLAFGVLVVVVLAVGAEAVSAIHRAARVRQAQAVSGAVELVSLDHQRDGSRLAVRGIIRNPARGEIINGVAAVVLLFDEHDMYLGAREGAILRSTLPPGGEASFEIVLPDAAGVSRYRVSFRTGKAPLPHVDRRGLPARARQAREDLTAGLVNTSWRRPLH